MLRPTQKHDLIGSILYQCQTHLLLKSYKAVNCQQILQRQIKTVAIISNTLLLGKEDIYNIHRHGIYSGCCLVGKQAHTKFQNGTYVLVVKEYF